MKKALAVWAGGSPFMAIEIAGAFAKATGGRVATIQDLFRLFQVQPEHPLFEQFILTDSVLMVGCDRRRHRTYPRTHLVHGSGFLTDPQLRAWYDENWKALTPEQRADCQGLRLSRQLWNALRDHESAIPLRSMTQDWWPTNRGKRGSIRGSLATQQRAIIGDGFKEIIEARRQSQPRPVEDPDDPARYRYHCWRRGEVGGFEFQDRRLSSVEFRRGEYALASPLAFASLKLDHRPEREHITLYSWNCQAWYVLALPRGWQPSDPIQFEPQQKLEDFLIRRADCYSPSASAFPEADEYCLVEPTPGAEGCYLVRTVTLWDEPGYASITHHPRCWAEIEAVVGETTLPLLFQGMTPSKEELRLLKGLMPLDAHAMWICPDPVKVQKIGAEIKPFAVWENVPVKFVRLRPKHPMRFLTYNEFFANPNEYLRRIGVGV